LLLGLGALSALLVVTIALRMDVLDREGHPIHLRPKALLYWPWLGWEIVKSNVDVARRILSPTLPISPTVIRLKASQKSELGKVIYANSITLTPGTVSIDIDGDKIEVHALTREAAQALRTGDMDRRVTRFEGDE
jgi:multicomponent Na+:H+ antiporter subunit E